jgi:hypothetical protein
VALPLAGHSAVGDLAQFGMHLRHERGKGGLIPAAPREQQRGHAGGVTAP